MNLIFSKAEATAAATAAKEESLNWFALNRRIYEHVIYILYDTAHSKCLSHHVNVIYVHRRAKKNGTESQFNWLLKQFVLQIQ